MNKQIAGGLVAVSSFVGTMAHAAVDVTAISSSMTDIAAVGAAVFALLVGLKTYKWIRRAL